MKTRTEVQELLEDVIGLGSDHVYFQDPPNTGMKYPCIIYRFVNFDVDYADNKPYKVYGYWEVHHMYKTVAKDLKEKFLFEVPFAHFDRRVVADGIYNDYYKLYQ